MRGCAAPGPPRHAARDRPRPGRIHFPARLGQPRLPRRAADRAVETAVGESGAGDRPRARIHEPTARKRGVRAGAAGGGNGALRVERAARPWADAARVGHLPPQRQPRCANRRSGSRREMLPASRRQQRAGRPFHPTCGRCLRPKFRTGSKVRELAGGSRGAGGRRTGRCADPFSVFARRRFPRGGRGR